MKHLLYSFRYIFLICCALILSGCATQNFTLDAPYRAQSSPREAFSAPIDLNITIRDARTMFDFWNSPRAFIINRQEVSVASYVQSGVEIELSRLGISKTTSAPFVLSGVIYDYGVNVEFGVTTFNETKMAGHFEMVVTVYNRDGVTLFTTPLQSKFQDKGRGTSYAGKTPVIYRKLLEKALVDLAGNVEFQSVCKKIAALSATQAQDNAAGLRQHSTVSTSPINNIPKQMGSPVLQNKNDIPVRLKKLKELKDSGAITESEYESQRKVLVEKL